MVLFGGCGVLDLKTSELTTSSLQRPSLKGSLLLGIPEGFPCSCDIDVTFQKRKNFERWPLKTSY